MALLIFKVSPCILTLNTLNYLSQVLTEWHRTRMACLSIILVCKNVLNNLASFFTASYFVQIYACDTWYIMPKLRLRNALCSHSQRCEAKCKLLLWKQPKDLRPQNQAGQSNHFSHCMRPVLNATEHLSSKKLLQLPC